VRPGGASAGAAEARARAVERLRRLVVLLETQGFTPGENLLAVVDQGARHHEHFWARRFPCALEFIFPPESN